MMSSIQKSTLTIDSDKDLLEQLKNFVSYLNTNLKQNFSHGINAKNLILTRAKQIDILLVGLWQHLNVNENYSLIAVGGYGRGELHPFSDIDLLVLIGKENQEQKKKQDKLIRFIALLWDAGLIISQATRSITQCIQLAKQDISVVTNLMESRFLCGNIDLFKQMKAMTAPSKIWPANLFFKEKIEEQRKRYKKFNGSSYDLEPNLKSSPGGLRDIQLIVWIAQRYYYPKSTLELIKKNIITKEEYFSLAKCQLFLWKTRLALHLTSNKAEDRLLFDYQKDTAKLMGFKDSNNRLAVEKMMQRYYRSVMIIRNISDILLQSFEEKLSDSKAKLNYQKLDRHFQIVNHRIDAIDTGIFNSDTSNLLKIFCLIAENNNIAGITATTLRAIRAARNNIDFEFTKNKANQDLFVKFLHINHSSSKAMFLIKKSGILSDYLPAFKKISGQMQYDMFHSYTVDEHTLFLLKNLIEFTHEKTKKQFPLCYEIMSKQSQPEIIYLAALFHDIGKGQGGDHSEIGAQEAITFCQQHPIEEKNCKMIEWLVRNHLLMSLTAQKRDTSDPKVIERFAQQVVSIKHLELLYILTVADIRATNGSLWNSWKDSLLKELTLSTFRYLKNQKNKQQQEQQHERQSKQQIKPIETWRSIKNSALKLLLNDRYKDNEIENYWQHLSHSYFVKNPVETITWHSRCILGQMKNDHTPNSPSVIAIRQRLDGAGNEVFIYSQDVDDLFASLTATLMQQGQNVQAASIYTDTNGYCYDSFFTLNDKGKASISLLEQSRLQAALRKNIVALNSNSIKIHKRMPRQIKLFQVNTEIIFSKDEFSPYTRLDITTRDQPGLLALLAQAFKQCNLRLHDARIATLGEKVEDSFIISHKNNDAVSNPEQQEKIKRTIKKQLTVSN